MSTVLPRLDQEELTELPVTIRNAGIAGAGGAGFPTHAKWQHLDSVDSLLVNHQESEPNYFMDKWLGREHADELATLFDGLLDTGLDRIVITAKVTDREKWLRPLEDTTGGRIYEPSELPIDDVDGIAFAYTEDKYEFGMESVLLRLIDDTVIGNELPRITAGSFRTRRRCSTCIGRSSTGPR